MRRIPALMTVSSLLTGCAQFSEFGRPSYPQTPAEVFAGYNYVPLDPLPVAVYIDKSCEGRKLGSTLGNLPDNAVRIAIRELSAKGNAGVGPVTGSMEGKSYQVILDYINADVSNIRFRTNGGTIDEGNVSSLTLVEDPTQPSGPNDFVVPVYVGVGLRLTANVTVLKGGVNLSSLGALSAAAEAQRITGSLVVQTLGITGKQVTGALPLPSELNPTTIQNAMQALGSIKAIVYDEPETIVTPRVTGIYNPMPKRNEQLINLIVSQLARNRVAFWRTCPAQTVTTGGPPGPEAQVSS